MGTISDSPQGLVLDGVFRQAFSAEGIHFEKQSDSFKIHSTYNTSVSLRGEGDVAISTQRALERNGMAIDTYATIQIIIKSGQNKTHWIIKQDDFEKRAHSIYDLVAESNQKVH